MDAVAVGGDLVVEVREVVLLQVLGELESSFQRAARMAVDVQHQDGLVAPGFAVKYTVSSSTRCRMTAAG